MFLFEVTNGYMGELYVRAYVWAATEEDALLLAQQAYQANATPSEGENFWATLHCEKLFCGEDEPFCTIPDDTGWKTGLIQH